MRRHENGQFEKVVVKTPDDGQGKWWGQNARRWTFYMEVDRVAEDGQVRFEKPDVSR